MEGGGGGVKKLIKAKRWPLPPAANRNISCSSEEERRRLFCFRETSGASLPSWRSRCTALTGDRIVSKSSLPGKINPPLFFN